MVGRIYKISGEIDGEMKDYYGSTTQTLEQRYEGHRKSYDEDKTNPCATYDLFKSDVEPTIELMEEIKNCKSKTYLLKREREWIENNECINKQLPILTDIEKVLDGLKEKEKKKLVDDFYKCPCGKYIQICKRTTHPNNNHHKYRMDMLKVLEEEFI
tara:strand:- start:90 stop:560 length:471 start_codon:yes stop_codon:yes gene_type:complete